MDRQVALALHSRLSRVRFLWLLVKNPPPKKIITYLFNASNINDVMTQWPFDAVEVRKTLNSVCLHFSLTSETLSQPIFPPKKYRYRLLNKTILIICHYSLRSLYKLGRQNFLWYIKRLPTAGSKSSSVHYCARESRSRDIFPNKIIVKRSFETL